MRRPGILYISYDGMLEPLGQSQVIAYLERLTDEYTIHILSFEKPADWADRTARDDLRARLSTAGLRWHPLTYHKAPTVPATAFDLTQGVLVALWLSLRHGLRLVHARSYLPALIGRIVTVVTRGKLLFDMRGLWADERVDGGLWPVGGRLYRGVKAIERRLLLNCDYAITLTHASRREIAGFDYLRDRNLRLDVIPTCADLDRFVPMAPRPAQFTLGYVGSVGTWYLFDEVLECFRLILTREPDARMLVVNRSEQQFVRDRIAALGIPANRVEITAAAHRDVPAMIARMTVGAAIIKPVYSKIASAPTKLAEYLGCGVPCMGNAGVGDMVDILEGERTGVALADISPESRAAAVDRLFALLAEPELAARCRSVAERLFSLDAGVASYRRIYRELLA